MERIEIEKIATLRRQNYSYQFIADKLGMPMNTVKSICRRCGLKAQGRRKTKQEKAKATLCKNCMRELQAGGRKDMLYCSDRCRSEWRKRNRKIMANNP